MRFRGIEAACITSEGKQAIEAADVIVIAPSNPIVSTGPILALPGVREALAAAAGRGTRSSRSAASSVGGPARPGGPDARDARPRADRAGRRPHLRGIADRFVLDTVDRALATGIETLGMRTRVTDTVMTDDAARARLAAEVLEFAVAE